MTSNQYGKDLEFTLVRMVIKHSKKQDVEIVSGPGGH